MHMNEGCRLLQNSGSHSNEPSAQVWLLIFVHMQGREKKGGLEWWLGAMCKCISM